MHVHGSNPINTIRAIPLLSAVIQHIHFLKAFYVNSLKRIHGYSSVDGSDDLMSDVHSSLI